MDPKEVAWLKLSRERVRFFKAEASITTLQRGLGVSVSGGVRGRVMLGGHVIYNL
jgi:hypothetical protein